MSTTTSGHPLFPVDADRDLPAIAWIIVQRDSVRGPDTCHRRFGPEELPDPETLFELFGGGSYLLTAYTERGQYAAKSRWRFAGRPKPLDGSGEEETEEEEPRQPAPAPAQAGHLDGGAALSVILPFVQMMMQSSQASAAQQTQLVMAVLGSQKEASASHIATMQALHNAHSEQMARLLGAMLETRGGGGGDAVDALTKGIELGREMGGSGGSDETGEVLEMIGSVIQGATNAGAGQGQGGADE